MEVGGEAGREDPGEVLGDAAAGDVGDAEDGARVALEHAQHSLHIDQRRSQKGSP